MIKLKETYERMFGPLIVEGNKDYYFHSKKKQKSSNPRQRCRKGVCCISTNRRGTKSES